MNQPNGQNNDQSTGLTVHFIKNRQQVKTVNAQIQGDRFYILLVKKGNVHILSGTKPVDLETGDLIVIPINFFWQINGSYGAIHMAMISLPAAFGFQSHWEDNVPIFLTFLMVLPFSKLTLDKRERTFLLLLFNLLAIKNRTGGENMASHETISIMVHLLQFELGVLYHKYDQGLPVSSPGKHRLLAGFLKFLARHYRTQHHIPFYADKLKVSAEYLSKRIKKVTGRSAKYFIKQAIVKEAMILLQGSSDIADIGRRLGFDDPSSFSRFFKRHTSMSPSAFRRNLNSKEML